MIEDVQLSRDFWLHEAPCWQKATPTDVAKLQETAARVLQPIRNQFGTTSINSWKWWRLGCVPRTGSHAQGGSLDLTVAGGRTREAWEWGNDYLMPSGYIGRWIYEPQTPTQGEHIHVAPRADMIAHNGDSRIQALEELPNGNTYVFREWNGGTFENPYVLPGFTVTARAGIPWWASLGLLGALFTYNMSVQASGGWVIGERRPETARQAVRAYRKKRTRAPVWGLATT